jgi:DNA-directed RNA polymerase specialized sigma24 family protein
MTASANDLGLLPLWLGAWESLEPRLGQVPPRPRYMWPLTTRPIAPEDFRTPASAKSKSTDLPIHQREPLAPPQALPNPRVDFDDFYRDSFPRLVAMLRDRYQLCRNDRGLAEDIVMETLHLASLSWDQIGRPGHNPYGWCWTVAIRLASRHSEKHARFVAHHELRSPDEFEWTPGCDDSLPREAFEITDLISRSPLSPQQKKMVALAVVWGLRNTEIADQLGVTPTTVASHLFHAKRRLRTWMESMT